MSKHKKCCTYEEGELPFTILTLQDNGERRRKHMPGKRLSELNHILPLSVDSISLYMYLYRCMYIYTLMFFCLYLFLFLLKRNIS